MFSLFRKTVAARKTENLRHAATELEKARCHFEESAAQEHALQARIDRLREEKPLPGMEAEVKESLYKAHISYEEHASNREMYEGHVVTYTKRMARIKRELELLELHEPNERKQAPVTRPEGSVGMVVA